MTHKKTRKKLADPGKVRYENKNITGHLMVSHDCKCIIYEDGLPYCNLPLGQATS